MKTKKYIVEILRKTDLKKRPEFWDLFVPTDVHGHRASHFYSRNEARRVIRKLTVGRAEARYVKLDRFKKGEVK